MNLISQHDVAKCNRISQEVWFFESVPLLQGTSSVSRG
jgi:hypothetical protein